MRSPSDSTGTPTAWTRSNVDRPNCATVELPGRSPRASSGHGWRGSPPKPPRSIGRRIGARRPPRRSRVSSWRLVASTPTGSRPSEPARTSSPVRKSPRSHGRSPARTSAVLRDDPITRGRQRVTIRPETRVIAPAAPRMSVVRREMLARARPKTHPVEVPTAIGVLPAAVPTAIGVPPAAAGATVVAPEPMVVAAPVTAPTATVAPPVPVRDPIAAAPAADRTATEAGRRTTPVREETVRRSGEPTASTRFDRLHTQPGRGDPRETADPAYSSRCGKGFIKRGPARRT